MTKRISRKKKNRAAQQKKTKLTVILIIAAFALAAVVMIVILQQNNTSTTGDIVIPTLTAKPQESGLSLGDPNAPIKVVEFADFQCTICYQYFEQMESSVIQTYVATGKVYYTFSPYIVFYQNRESIDATEAAYCANDQGKFWAFHDTLFTNYLGEYKGSYTSKRLKAMAEGIGLDMTVFNTCYDNQKNVQQIQDAISYGESVGLAGTPSFLVNGTLVSASELVAAIDAALAASK